MAGQPAFLKKCIDEREAIMKVPTTWIATGALGLVAVTGTFAAANAIQNPSDAQLDNVGDLQSTSDATKVWATPSASPTDTAVAAVSAPSPKSANSPISPRTPVSAASQVTAASPISPV